MGFSSFDDLISEITSGKVLTQPFNKITGGAAYTAGRWYDMFSLAGIPVAGSIGGTTAAFQSCTDSTTGSMYLGGNKTPDTRHFLFSELLATVSTGVPSWMLFVDMLGYYPSFNMNSSAAQSTNSTAGTNVLPNRQGVQDNGVGVRAFIEAQATTGATATNFTLTYTNTGATSGQTNPTVAATASAIVPHIIHSGTAANNFGPFMPLATGDLGITSVQSLKLSVASGSASHASVMLARPLFWVPMTTVHVASGRDAVFNVPAMPQIPDSACVVPLLYAGGAVAASTGFLGVNTFAWG